MVRYRWADGKWNRVHQFSVHQDGVKSYELTETNPLNFTNAIEDTTICIDKQTSIVTPSMKRAKPTNLGSNLKPSKKSKARIASDDPDLANDSQSEEVSGPTVVQTFDKAENLYSEKKKPGKRKKVLKLQHSTISSTRKKGKLLANSGDPKTLPEDAGDSTLETTPKSVEKECVTTNSPIPVILGLQCHAVTVSQSNKSTQSTSKSPQKVVESGAPQLDVLLASKATDNQERNETDSKTLTRKKRGRPVKTQSKNINHQNGEASVKKVPSKSKIELNLQPEKTNQSAKGKRGKRRMISLNVTTLPQEVQDSSKQKEIGNSEVNVEKSLDTVLDDQPLSRWFLGKHSLATVESTGKKQPENSKCLSVATNGDGQTLTFGGKKQPENSKSLLAVTNGDGQTLTFEKRSTLWETIESMEAFRLIPQKPHFRPLDNIKESARERHAINKMVDFSAVFEETQRLRIDHPRTEIEDQLEALLELETHGFDIDYLRNRLMELISLKDKREGLESRLKEVKDNLGIHRVEVQKLDKDSESIDKQVTDLLEKRNLVLKEKEKKASEIVGLEAEMDEIDKAMREYCCKFDELATTSFV